MAHEREDGEVMRHTRVDGGEGGGWAIGMMIGGLGRSAPQRG